MIMILGQIVRELHMDRQILVLLSAPKPEAQQLMEHALKFMVEMRTMLYNWREREGIEIPEYDREEEQKILDRLVSPGKEDQAEPERGAAFDRFAQGFQIER